MAKIQFRNDSVATIYLDSFSHQQILVSEVVDLFDQETKLKGDTQIITLINAGDLVLIDDTGTDRTAAEALKILDGTVDLVRYGGSSYDLLCTDPSGDLTWTQGAVLIKEEGTLVNSVPFNTLNFVGSSITATDATGGQVDVTVTDGGATTLSAVQARRTTSFNITTSFANIPLDSTDVETDATVVEHNNTNTERIDIKVNGTYTVLYSLPTIITSAVSAQINVFTKVLKNGITLLAGSDLDVGYHYSATYSHSEHVPNNRSVTMPLIAGDYLTLHIKYTELDGPITSLDTNGDVIFKVIKLDGVQGAAGTDGADGAPGSGTTLIAKDEGTNVANTPHSAFNFVGSGVTVTDAGAGVADVTVSGGGIYGSEFQQASSDTESSTTDLAFQQKLRMTTSSLPSGTYRVAWYYEWKHTHINHDFTGRVQINDIITIMEHQEESRDAGEDQYHNHGGFYYHTGSGILNVDIDYSRSNSAGGTSYIRRARLEIWRVS